MTASRWPILILGIICSLVSSPAWPQVPQERKPAPQMQPKPLPQQPGIGITPAPAAPSPPASIARLVKVTGGGFSPPGWLVTGVIWAKMTGLDDAVMTAPPVVTTVDWRLCRFIPRAPAHGGGHVFYTDSSDRKQKWLTIVGMIEPGGGLIGSTTGVEARHCELDLLLSLRSADGRDFPFQTRLVFDVSPHQRVVVADTARLRSWLKPTAGCSMDDAGNQLGLRITTGPAGAACRTDFMTVSNHSSQNYNMWPEGVVPVSVKWRVEGDRNQCMVCPDPRTPCLGPPALAAALASAAPVRYDFRLLGTVIAEGTMNIPGITSAPPHVPENTSVMTEDQTIIGYNTDRRFHVFMLAMYAGMSCNAWAPPASDVAGAIGSAIGAAARGQQAPPPPPAPSLRLVLDEMVLLRPPTMPLPFQ